VIFNDAFREGAAKKDILPRKTKFVKNSAFARFLSCPARKGGNSRHSLGWMCRQALG